jgi:NAD(P)-dependent dehydrogenase (short-subunit alcohol dehydrogenase family)
MTARVNADRARSRTFVVTGAASGIGLATARRLLAEGGTVVGADLAAPPDDLAFRARDFLFVTADVADEAAVAAVLAAVPDRLDGVFHAAGVAGGGPVHLLDRAEWDRVIGINLTGTFLVVKAALAKMIEQPRVDGERGSIVTVASIEGLEGTAGGSSYNAAKGGAVLLAKNIALDYGPSGIRANAICPGFIEAPMARAFSACRDWRVRWPPSPRSMPCNVSADRRRSRRWRRSCCLPTRHSSAVRPSPSTVATPPAAITASSKSWASPSSGLRFAHGYS